MKRYFPIVCFLLFVFCNLSQAAVIGSTDDAMTIGGGARPIGMGRAHVAIVEDADAPFINPAGLAAIKGPQAMSMFTNLLGEVYYSEVSGAVPTQNGTVGVGYITTGVNNIPTAGTPTDYYDSLLLFSYSVPLGRFFNYGRNVFLGANYKIFNRGYTGGVNQYATGQSADFGMKVILSPNLSLGFCRQNILPVSMGGVIRLSAGAEESLASLVKIGAAIKPTVLPKVVIAIDSDLPQQTGRPVTSHLGVEWEANDYLMLRAGADQSVDPGSTGLASWNPSYGTSLGYKGFRIDYAYHAYYNDPALATHYVSLSYIGAPWYALKGRTE
ncbi:hypothetical protein HZC35_05945 [Candidatus Saganbacteria bacterium]|nr:hypothetical protein [Candidatus Saganbacteria bacterium]